MEMIQNPLFDEDYVSLQLFLETLNVKDSVEKDRFFGKLADRVPNLPKPGAQWKVLPRWSTRSSTAARPRRSSRCSRSPRY